MKPFHRLLTALLVAGCAFSEAGISYALTGVPDTLITRERFMAFYQLAQGRTQWPVWQVAKGAIVPDGRKTETAWDQAAAIYLTGEKQWNENYHNAYWFYGGHGDFVSVWRLMHDSTYLYISCEYFDDLHSEGLYAEKWWLTDAVELTVFDPGCYGYSIGGTVRKAKIWRRFTKSTGLQGRVWVQGMAGTLDSFSYAASDGDAKLCNVYGRADTISSSCVRACYPGAWFMEVKIPLCQIKSSHAPANTHFKLGLKIIDDDYPSSGPSTQTPVFGIGMERYPAWWKMDSLVVTNPHPTFKLMGFRNYSDGTDSLPLQELLYCGHTVREYFESTGALYSAAPCPCTNVAVQPTDFHAVSSLAFFPNPFSTRTKIAFTGPFKSGAALTIFNLRGEIVHHTALSASGKVTWNGKSKMGTPVPAGIYFVKLKTAGFSTTQRLTIIP